MGRPVVHVPDLVAIVACLGIYAAIGSAKPPAQSNEMILERMQIFVNVTDGPILSLSVEKESYVADLRYDLNAVEGFPFDYFHLQLGNTKLSRENKLSEYGIQDGTTLTLVVVPNPRFGEVIVRTRNGQELRVTPQHDESVVSLKQRITQLTGTPQMEQRLLLKGKELRDDRKLMHYFIHHGTQLDLGQPLEDCRRVVLINVRTLSGATVEVEVNLADTVNVLKEKIWVTTGVPAEVQHLSVDNHERVIAGEDHLCDLGLGTGSIVYMFLYSTKITGLYRVARLREPPVGNHRAPIFHEAEDETEPVQNGRRRSYSLFKDVRNWLPRDNLGVRFNPDLFDPIAHLAPNPDNVDSINGYRRNLEEASNPGADDWLRQEAPMNSARLKLSLAVRPYRLAANLTSKGRPRQYPGITLGGGSIDVSPEQPVPLGADVNNWAPDAFTDSDLMRLFEVAERVRQVLARGLKTGADTLSIPRQRQINHAILSMYLDALAGYRSVGECDQPKEGEQCSICQDELMVEPAIMLPCKHGFHIDCIVSGQSKLYQMRGDSDCHFCRQRFLFPYELYGKAELESPDLLVDQDEREFSS